MENAYKKRRDGVDFDQISVEDVESDCQVRSTTLLVQIDCRLH